jgi:hypothetical protein
MKSTEVHLANVLKLISILNIAGQKILFAGGKGAQV